MLCRYTMCPNDFIMLLSGKRAGDDGGGGSGVVWGVFRFQMEQRLAQLPVWAAASERANDTDKHMPSVTALTTAVRLNPHLDMYTTQTSYKTQSQLRSNSSLALLKGFVHVCMCAHVLHWRMGSESCWWFSCCKLQVHSDTWSSTSWTADALRTHKWLWTITKKTFCFDLMQHNVHISQRASNEVLCFVSECVFLRWIAFFAH